MVAPGSIDLNRLAVIIVVQRKTRSVTVGRSLAQPCRVSGTAATCSLLPGMCGSTFGTASSKPGGIMPMTVSDNVDKIQNMGYGGSVTSSA